MMKLFLRYIQNRQASAGVEAALLLPFLFVMLFGVWEVGNALTANHKMITATQVVADLLARNSTATQNDVDQAIEAAKLAMMPYVQSTSGFGIDIISVRFDAQNNPTRVWEKSYSMGASADATRYSDAALTSTTGLGTSGEGAMVVTMIYDFRPTFGSGVISSFRMKEAAFSRGRRSSVVAFQ